MRDIADCKNYRLFLSKQIEERRKEDPKFTLAAFAKKAKFKSANHLQMILSGKRALTTTNLHYLAAALDLLGNELDYFESMVLENQSGSAVERRFYLKRMSAQRKILTLHKQDKSHNVNRSSLIESSDFAAVAVLANNLSHSHAVLLIDKALSLSSKEAEVLLSKVVHKQGLTFDGGKYKTDHRNLMVINTKGLNLEQTKFMRDGLLENLSTFDREYPQGVAKFLNLLFTAPAGSLDDLFSDLKLKVELLRQSYGELDDNELGVYRVQVQLYRHRSKEK